MRNLLAPIARTAKGLRERLARPTDAGPPHQPDYQVASAELYIYRLRHLGMSIDEVAADLGVSPRTLQSWVHANWKW